MAPKPSTGNVSLPIPNVISGGHAIFMCVLFDLCSTLDKV